MKKIRNLVCFSLCCLAVLFLFACTKTPPAVQPEPQEETGTADNAAEPADNGAEGTSLTDIQKKGTITLGTSADYPPYEFHILRDGVDEIVGFDVEIAREMAKDLGVELKVVDMNFDGLLIALNTGQVDFVMAGMTPSDERREAVDFSDIYYYAEQTVVVRAEDKDKYTSIDSLDGLKVAAQRGSIQEGIVEEQMPNVNLISLTKIPNIVLELKNKKVEAAVMERPVAEGYVNSNSDIVISDVPVVDETGGSAVALRKDSGELLKSVNDTIKRLENEGLIDKFVAEANELVVAEE